MNPDAREQARHQASVMIAFAEGKEIQTRPQVGRREWADLGDSTPSFDWSICDYRVKPEERKPLMATIYYDKEGVIYNAVDGHSDEILALMDRRYFVEVLPSENTGGQDV